MRIFRIGRHWWCAGITPNGQRWWACTSVAARRPKNEAQTVAQRIERNGWYELVPDGHTVTVAYRPDTGDSWYLWCAVCQQKAARCKKCQAIHHLHELGEGLACNACLTADSPSKKAESKPEAKPKRKRRVVSSSNGREGYAPIDWEAWGQRVVRQVARKTRRGTYLALDCPRCNRRTLMLGTGNVKCDNCRMRFFV